LGRLFNICPATAMNWVKRYANAVAEPEVSADLRHIKTDEMRHFLDSTSLPDTNVNEWINFEEQ
jgi:hypothetical protein